MEEINLKELWQYFWQRKLIFLAIAIGVMLLGNLYAEFFQVPLYKSTTSLVLVNEENSNTGITQNDVNLNNNLLSTYSEIVTSRTVLSDVKKNLKLKESIDELSKCISVTAVSNTQLIKIEVSRESKKEAKQIADEIAMVFSEKITNIYKIQNISIVDEAQVPRSPYNKNFLKQNAIFIFIGLILSVFSIFIIYYFDTSIKDASTIEDKLGLTVFGTVPKVGDKDV